MKKASLILLAAVLILLVACGFPTLAEEPVDELDEWTVLFYFCGSDLESNHSYATDNLKEIASVSYLTNYLPVFAEEYGVDIGQLPEPGAVNILIETGGAKEWHTQDLEMDRGMDVDVGALQRWRHNYYPIDYWDWDDEPCDGFELLETLRAKEETSHAEA